MNKEILKKWWFWVVSGSVILCLFFCAIFTFFAGIVGLLETPETPKTEIVEETAIPEITEEPTLKPTEKATEKSKTTKKPKKTKKPKATKKPKKEDYNIERGEIIGRSNKNFKDLDMTFFGSVHNDKTGNFCLTEFAKQVDFNEYALSYAENNIKKGEIHYVINMTNKVTAVIRDAYFAWEVYYTEYENGEEHDANKIGEGMPLGQYWIYKDNGDIEKIG